MNRMTRWTQLRWNRLNELNEREQNVRCQFSSSRVRWPQPPLPQWVPVVDVSENPAGYVLKAELPQVEQADVKITLADGTLTITGDRKFIRNSKRLYPVKHAYGRFAHSFTLPADACPASVSAMFKNGLLTVHIAKSSLGRLALTPGLPGFSESQLENEKENANETAIIT